jgi:hypothetical protein
LSIGRFRLRWLADPWRWGFEVAQVAGAENMQLFRGVADAVAQYGYRSMLRGRIIAIPGVKNKFAGQIFRTSPRKALRILAERLN